MQNNRAVLIEQAMIKNSHGKCVGPCTAPPVSHGLCNRHWAKAAYYISTQAVTLRLLRATGRAFSPREGPLDISDEELKAELTNLSIPSPTSYKSDFNRWLFQARVIAGGVDPEAAPKAEDPIVVELRTLRASRAATAAQIQLWDAIMPIVEPLAPLLEKTPLETAKMLLEEGAAAMAARLGRGPAA
jgi:hypothetical protein